jgi:transcriptional regulator with XRE-family HTH domain
VRRIGEASKNQTPLARMRIARGLTQEELAEATGIPRRTYQDIERGARQKAPLAQLINCAIVLDCTLDELLEERHKQWTEFTSGVVRPAVGKSPRRRTGSSV